MSQTRTLRGVIHGQTITLDHPVDFAEGEAVEITIVPVSVPGESADETGDLPGFGSWSSEGADLDEYLEWCRVRRQASQKR